MTNQFQRWAILGTVLLGISGCMSTYEYEKDTVVIFTFGIGLAFVREKDAGVEVGSLKQADEGNQLPIEE